MSLVDDGAARRTGKACSHKPVMNEMGKSDEPIVPVKRPNNAARVVAEAVEGRGEAKGNAAKRNADRTQSRSSPARNELDRVRSRARKDKKASLARRAILRQDPRWEPSAVTPLAGSCAGGGLSRKRRRAVPTATV